MVTTSGIAQRPIVLVHGLFMTSLCWEGWVERLEKRGHEVVAPDWPGLEVGVEELRRDPSPIRSLSVKKIVDHYDRIVSGMERPPILMGHSFGGAFVQVLLSRGLGAAGVAINSAQVRGVLDLPPSTVKSLWPVLRNPLMRRRSVSLTPRQFNYAFTNHLEPNESNVMYDRYVVPGSRNVLFEGAYANLNPRSALKVDFKKDDRAPLLFVAGGNDHIVPASVNRHNAAKYRKAEAVTAIKEYPGRTHFTLGQEGWEEVADHALDWAERQAR